MTDDCISDDCISDDCVSDDYISDGCAARQDGPDDAGRVGLLRRFPRQGCAVSVSVMTISVKISVMAASEITSDCFDVFRAKVSP